MTSINERLVGLQPRLLRFAYKLTNEMEEAEDLLQETNLRILENMEKYVSEISFSGWCFMVMRNKFLNEKRTFHHNRVVLDDTENEYLINSTEAVKPDYESEMDLDLIMRESNKLPEKLRVVFKMYLSGFDCNEISERLGIPSGTARSRMFHARKRIVKRLNSIL